ncbi:MAG: hypothetical protein V1906_02755 [Candidatus Woesearchaeota archaeon]
MKRLKSIMAFVTLILLCSLAIAEDKELFKPTEGGSVVCENCLTGDVCKGKLTSTSDYQFNCDKTCTIKMKDEANKELWSMRLNGACVSFNKKGYPEEIKALKDLTEDLNINGYLTKIKADDYIWFEYSVKTLSNDINSPRINIYGSKDKEGSISPFTICDQTFYPRSHPMTSEFKVSRPLKKDGKSYGCEIAFYQIYNQNDVKKDKEGKPQYKTYYQKCGDISYNAYDNGINSLSCEPKIEYTDNAARKKESRLYCSQGNSGCKMSSFSISIYGQSSGYPLSVQIRGGQYADKTNFKSVVSKTEIKKKLPLKSLEADNFAIGSQSFWPKPKDGEKTEVQFIEEPQPTMYVPNGINIEMYTVAGAFLTYKYLPEFSSPTNKKFEGYWFKFDPQKQYPSMVYPANFDLSNWNIKNMAEAKLFAGSSYHAGLKPVQKFDGGLIYYKGKDGNTYSTYKNVVVEWRADPAMMDPTSAKKDTVSVKPCTGEGCALTANKQCGPVTVKAEMDYASISDYVTVKLGYVKPKVPVVAPKPTAVVTPKPATPTATTPKPTTVAPAGKKRIGGRRGGAGRRAKPQGEDGETVMMEPGDLTAEQKTNVAKFVTMIIKLNEKKKLKDPKDTIDDNIYYAAEVNGMNGGKEYIKVWSHFPTINNDKKVDGVKKDDMFKAPSELLYPNKCKGQVNVGADKKMLSTAGFNKVSPEDAKKWNIQCKDNKFIRTTDNKEFLPDKQYCLIEKAGRPGNTIYNYKCVNNEPYYKSTKCTCTSNTDGTGKCLNAKPTPRRTGTAPATQTTENTPPDTSWERPQIGDWTPFTTKDVNSGFTACRGGTLSREGTWCNDMTDKGQGIFEYNCINNWPYYKLTKCPNGCTTEQKGTDVCTGSSKTTTGATTAQTSSGVSCSEDANCGRELVCGLNKKCVQRCVNNQECNTIYNDKSKYMCENFRCKNIKCSPQNYGIDCNTMAEMKSPKYRCDNGICTSDGFRYVTNKECDSAFAPSKTGFGQKVLPSITYTSSQGYCSTNLLRCTTDSYCKDKTFLRLNEFKKYLSCSSGFCVYDGFFKKNPVCLTSEGYVLC